MAGDWIKMRGNLWDDPRVGAIVDATDSSEAAVVGALYWLWATADQHTEDGCMPGLTLRQIDRKTGVPGFAAALLSIGWISEAAEGIVITKFEEHNGTSAKRRATDAQRKANSRNVSASDADKQQTEAGQNTPHLGAREREEKRREEDTTPIGVGGDAAKPAADLTKDELWKAGKSLLEQSGMPKAQCGSFVGRLVKDYGDVIVVDAVRSAVLARPADPVEYLKATCMRTAGQRAPVNKQEALEQRNRSVADAWASEGADHAAA